MHDMYRVVIDEQPGASPASVSVSNTGLPSSPGMVGKKNGAAAGFVGGSIGLLRSCNHAHRPVYFKNVNL